jgi:tRNA-uridine 2-sulfurtransferase
MVTQKEKVVIAMSGGVDSSVAAALLVEKDYDVTGVMLRLWSPPGCDEENRCCSPESLFQARKIAGLLNIPFYAIDAREKFFDEVVSPFLHELKIGSTPNPCVFCNRKVRWGMLLDTMKAFGAKYLATGHYARIRQKETGEYQLLKGVDLNKDQSYVLSVLNQEQLAQTIFPLGEMIKPDVRQIARQKGLEVADKEDSQDLCFLADLTLEEFIGQQAPEIVQPGPIVDKNGRLVGQHQGLAFYTIGQRKGLGFAAGFPQYVLRKDVATNTLVVGRSEELGLQTFWGSDFHWISSNKPDHSFAAMIKIRYKAKETQAMIIPHGNDPIEIQLNQPARDVTPGQRVVIYQDDVCLGGGTIAIKTGE